MDPIIKPYSGSYNLDMNSVKLFTTGIMASSPSKSEFIKIIVGFSFDFLKSNAKTLPPNASAKGITPPPHPLPDY